MQKGRSESNIGEKFKSYVTGIMLRNFLSSNKIDKYFRMDISISMSKAIEENWIRLLGIDYDIISLNLSKNNQPLGIALDGRLVRSMDSHEMVNRHFLHVIRPNLCVGSTNRFMVGDELLEVNGLKIYGMPTKDVISALKKLPDYIQIVVGRPHRSHEDENSDNEDMNEPICFYDMDEDISSRTCTLKSNSSLFSTTSRDYGSMGSMGDHGDGSRRHVYEYLRDIIGWRGPIVLEFRKERKESLGLALEEISDPKTSELIIVFKIIVPGMRAHMDGRLHVGDRLLQVNGKSVMGAPFRKVCQWMKSSNGGRLILYICKPLFPTLNIDNSDDFPDSYLTSTLSRTNKLEKLSEEGDRNAIDIPPVPESRENRLSIKRIDDKLGLFLDIVDNGNNGCRIRRMVKGQAKDNGRLHEGDYITSINGLSLRIDDKNKLEHCLRIIAKSGNDYEISFITKEDVDLHKRNYIDQRVSSICKGLYPDTDAVMSQDTCEFSIPSNSYDLTMPPKQCFETYNVTLEYDGTVNLGLVLFPSLIHPNRYVAITDIHPNSLADRSKALKINDELLSVNNTSLERMTPTEVGIHLKKLLQTDSILRFKIQRLLGSEDHLTSDDNCNLVSSNQYSILSDLPDMYFYSIEKTRFGYGLSVKELTPSGGVGINKIDPESPAAKAHIIKPDQRFVMIDNSPVWDCSVNTVFQLVKNSQRSISLVMETQKFREFNVRVVKDASNSLGLNVGGGIDTQLPMATIESMDLNTTCQFSEPLQPDDFIVEVNQTSMLHLTHESIIQVLRALPKENNFKIWRKMPFIKRDFSMLDSSSFLDDYLQRTQFSVVISKPVASIVTYGIKLGDVVIAAPDSYEVLDRYRCVVSVEKGSLIEKYAPDVVPYCYLISVNGSIVDMDLSCDSLRETIDCEDKVGIVFSRDIPYRRSIDSGVDESIFVDNIVPGSNYSSISDQDPTELECGSELQNKRVHFYNGAFTDDIPNDKIVLSNDDNRPTIDAPICDDIQHSGTDSILINDSTVPITDVTEDCSTDDRACQTEPCSIESSPMEYASILDDQLSITKQPVVTECGGDDRSTSDGSSNVIGLSMEQYGVGDEDKSLQHNDHRTEIDLPTNSSNVGDHNEDYSIIEAKEPQISEETSPDVNDTFIPEIISIEVDVPLDSEEKDRLILKESSVIGEDQLSPEVDSSKVTIDGKDSPSCNGENIEDSLPMVEDKVNEINPEEEMCVERDRNDHSSEKTQLEDDLGITISQVVVPMVDNLELGFQVIGGVAAGPDGETLPIYVISVERNTRNWLPDQQEPLLSNGTQLLDLNGHDLSICDLSSIERMLASTTSDLTFKVIKTN